MHFPQRCQRHPPTRAQATLVTAHRSRAYMGTGPPTPVAAGRLGPAATKRKNVVRWWGCIAGTCCMRSPSSSHLSWITLSMPAVRSWSANAVLRPAATKTSVTVVQSRSCCCSVPRLGPAATKRKDVVRWWGCIAGTCCRAWRSRRSAQHKNLHGEVKSNNFWP